VNLAVSNIAWAAEDCAAAYELLNVRGIAGLEIAPALFFDGAADVFAPTHAELARALDPVRSAGLEIVSMQSLLYGVADASLFGDDGSRHRFADGMRRAINLAGLLSIPNLVFGSPRQRVIPEGMSHDLARRIALDVLGELGDAAESVGTLLGIEFNPARYGTNFLNGVTQAAAFVRELNHSAVTLILDTGAMHINGDFDQIESVARAAADIVSHVHLSEPDLAPAPAHPRQAARVLSAMSRAGYTRWYSIEMKPSGEPGLSEVEAAIDRLLLGVRSVLHDATEVTG
jgi:sugar phosphate isomerase/epimerase